MRNKMIAFLFPGQGAQFVGMGKELFNKFPEIVYKADEILNYSIKELNGGILHEGRERKMDR